MKIHKVLQSVLMFAALLFILQGWTSVSASSIVFQTAGSIYYVKEGGSGNCSSWAQACELQAALTSAASGDQIWVAAGTYKPDSNTTRLATFTLESGVTILGGFPAAGGGLADRNWQANPTILSGDIGVVGNASDNSFHVVTASGVDASAILDGFTITLGNANGSPPDDRGGGMYNYAGSPTLTNLVFKANLADYGGGIFNDDHSSPILTNVSFVNNHADYLGGGMYNNYHSSPTQTGVSFTSNSAENGGGMANSDSSSPTLSNVNFSSNIASYGGGLYNATHSSPILTDVSFLINTASNQGGGMANSASSPSLENVIFEGNSADVYGGGMVNVNGSSPNLESVTFNGNMAQYGGGMENFESSPILNNVNFGENTALHEGGGLANYSSSPTITNSTFNNNSAEEYGGGVYNGYSSSPTLTNVTFYGNNSNEAGGGMENAFSSSPTLTNATFNDNSALYGGGIYNYQSSATLKNAIMWGNIPNQIEGDPAIVSYSDIQGGYTGTGNINADPRLGPLEDNGGPTPTQALGVGSPAIDHANPNPLSCPATDQRGVLRPIDGDGNGTALCDMGAYEYEPGGFLYIYLPLVLKN